MSGEHEGKQRNAEYLIVLPACLSLLQLTDGNLCNEMEAELN